MVGEVEVLVEIEGDKLGKTDGLEEARGNSRSKMFTLNGNYRHSGPE